MDPSLAEAARTAWTISLAVFVVVLLVVALLLTLILRAARAIRGGVSEIWNTGQKIANNTIHIALLRQTNATAGEILAAAGNVVAATAAVREHAGTCPGCPACVLGTGWQR